MMFERSPEFESLMGRVQACRACPRMCGSVRVLSWANGRPDAPLMFIGEAPGRLGADRTAIPFHGDKAGDNFERLLELARLNRSDVFVTNAALCNPRDEKGNNAPPSSREILNCAIHLKAQIEIVQPLMVMTLGAVALEATRLIEPHELVLREAVRTAHKWHDRLLLPLYHPGARAMIHRSFANQTADYYFVGETFRRAKSGRRSRPQAEVRGSEQDWALVSYLLRRSGRISNFRLHKLLYLIDLKSTEALASRATGFLYLRQKNGPYCVELGSRWYQRFGTSLSIRKTSNGELLLQWQNSTLFDEDPALDLSPDLKDLADQIVLSTSSLSDAQLKTRAYLTGPMKQVLRAEKAGRSTLNQPLLAAAA